MSSESLAMFDYSNTPRLNTSAVLSHQEENTVAISQQTALLGE